MRVHPSHVSLLLKDSEDVRTQKLSKKKKPEKVSHHMYVMNVSNEYTG